MAKIQTLGAGQKISMGGIKVAVKPKGGQVTQALVKAGAEIAGVTGQLLQKRAEAEATNFSDNANRQLKSEEVDLKKELDQKYAQDPTGYAEEYGTRMKENQEKIAGAAPSDMSKNLFTKRSENFVFSSGLNARTAENRNRSIKYQTDQAKAGDVAGDMFYKNPDSLGANLDIMEREQELTEQTGVTVDAKGASNLMEDYRKKVRNGVLQGVIDREYSSISNAKAPIEQRKKDIETFIAGSPETAELFKGMTPIEKNRFKAKAFRQLESSYDKEKSHLLQKSTMLSNAIAGGVVDTTTPGGLQLVQKHLAALHSDTSLDSFQKSSQIAKVAKSMISQDIESQVALMGEDAAAKQMDSLITESTQSFKEQNPLVAASFKADVKRDFGRIAEKVRNEKFKDPAAFYTKHDPALEALAGKVASGDPEAYTSYRAQMDSYYEKDNIPYGKRSYLDPKTQKIFGDTFKTAVTNKDWSVVEDIFSKAENMTQGESFKVMREIDMPPEFMAIGGITNSADRQRSLQLVGEADKINGIYRDKVGTGTKDSDVMAELKDDSFYQAFERQDFASLQSTLNADAMADVALLEYKAAIGTGSDKKEAMAVAMKSFKKSNTFFKGQDGKSSVVIPKAAMRGADQDRMNSFFDLTTGENGDRLDSVIDFDKIQVPALNESDLENYKANISANGFWSYSRATGRLHLRVGRNTKDGVKYSPVKNKDKSDVSFTPQEISEMGFDVDPWVEERAARIKKTKAALAAPSRGSRF